MQTTRDNRCPPPPESFRPEFQSYRPKIWVWNDGQVGGPFELNEVAELERERGPIHGMLARIDGGDWVPLPELERTIARQAFEAGRPKSEIPSPSHSDALFRVIMGCVAVLLVGLIGFAAWREPGTMFAVIGIPTLVLLTLAVYFLPSIVASHRQHEKRLAIGVLNLVGGWSLVGWIVALVWACT